MNTDKTKQSNCSLPRIALVADVENWAFHNCAKQISKNLSKSFEIKTLFYSDYDEIEQLILELKDFDLIHFFWRGGLLDILAETTLERFLKKGWNYKEFLTDIFTKLNITTSVHDHLFLTAEEIKNQEILFNALVSEYTVCSERLKRIYSNIPSYPEPTNMIENGVDLSVFTPRNQNFHEMHEIVIGWAGNSKWGVAGSDHKGLETIIKPVIEELKSEGYKIRGEYADRQQKWIHHSDMKDYYNKIDIYICASETEGSPDPVLESMACGIPVISTDVGIIPQLFGAKQKEFILESRSKEKLKFKILELIKYPEKRKNLSEENIESVKEWSWEKQCRKWKLFFSTVLDNSQNPHIKERKVFLRRKHIFGYIDSKKKVALQNQLVDYKRIVTEYNIIKSLLEKSQQRMLEQDKWTQELSEELEKSQQRMLEQDKWTQELSEELEKSQQRMLEQDKWTQELSEELEKSQKLNKQLQADLSEIQSQKDVSELSAHRFAQELTNARNTIARMEASKFWKLRNHWFKLKKQQIAIDVSQKEDRLVNTPEKLSGVELNEATKPLLDQKEQESLRPFIKSDYANSNKSEGLPKVALIADVQNWAFHNYAKQISKHLGDKYDFQIFFYGEYPEIETLMLEVKNFDLIHFFWRDALFSFLSSQFQHSFASKGLDYFDFVTNFMGQANITTSIYDHLFLSEEEIDKRKILYNALSIGYTTVSQRLKKIYSEIEGYPKPYDAIEDGVDLDFFVPHDLQRLSDQDRDLVVGWVGNSKWGGDGIDHKGIETIIKPVVEQLKSEGYKIRGDYADRHVRWVPHGEMNDYYNSIDIYVCASDIEGTPNPALESMACGIPVISTDVGMIPQLFGAKQKEFILESRSKDALRSKLIELLESPQRRVELSEENLERIKEFSWEKQCQKWDAFFEQMIFISRDPGLVQRIRYIRKQLLSNFLKKSIVENNELVEYKEDTTTNSESLHLQYQELESSINKLNTEINLIQESKFWKLRNNWFKVKRKLGLAKNEY